MRRQPVRIVDGRVEGGYTGVFEFICPGCGDNPYVDYSEIPPRLQWLRGPRTLEAALEAYDKHLGPLPGPNGDSAGSLGPGRGCRVASISRDMKVLTMSCLGIRARPGPGLHLVPGACSSPYVGSKKLAINF